MAHHTAQSARGRRGFTLVEMLVVVATIVVLAGIVIGVGLRAFGSQRAAATRGLLKTLDRGLEEYIAVQGTIPPYQNGRLDPGDTIPPDYGLYRGGPGPFVVTEPLDHPAAGWSTDDILEEYPDDSDVGHSRFPHTGPFFLQAQGYEGVDAIVESIDSRFLFSYTFPAQNSSPDNPYADQRGPAPIVADGWAASEWSEFDIDNQYGPDWDILGPNGNQLIYYVHPDNRLAQDLYGRCQSGRPYFMSAGPDKRYGLGGGLEQPRQRPDESDAAYRARIRGALDDNLYSYTPGAAKRSDDFFTDWRDWAP